jgi:starch phosphorylase
LERIYTPAAGAYARRTEGGARVAKALSQWHDDLEAAWTGIRFGELAASVSNEGLSFQVTVSLGDVGGDAVRVELYADPFGESPVVRVPMRPCASERPRVGTSAFECTIATSRPASDFTARVVPFHPDARLPLELPLVTWQR